MATPMPVHVSANVWVGIDTVKGTVIPKELTLSRDGRHEVEWYCIDKTASAVVKFVKGSPFESSEFHIPAGGTACSGPVLKDTPNTNFEYQISVVSLGPAKLVTATNTVTPGIIIIRP